MAHDNLEELLRGGAVRRTVEDADATIAAYLAVALGAWSAPAGHEAATLRSHWEVAAAGARAQ